MTFPFASNLPFLAAALACGMASGVIFRPPLSYIIGVGATVVLSVFWFSLWRY